MRRADRAQAARCRRRHPRARPSPPPDLPAGTPARLDDSYAVEPRTPLSARRRGPARPGAEASSTSSWRARAPRWTPSAPTSRRWSRHVADLIAGGKRLRPAFCYWGWRGAGGADSEPIVRGGRLARAAAGVRADPRRRHGRLRHPPRPAGRAPPVRRAAPRQRLARVAGERSGSARRSCVGDLCLSGPTSCCSRSGLPAEALLRGQAGLRRDAHRADGRAVPRPARAGAGGRRLASSGRCAWSGTRARSTPSSARCTSAAALAGAGRRPAGGVLGVRAAARRGVPAARRRPRGVRRPGGDRQAGRRRPARGQADGAGRARAGARDAGAGRARRAGLGDPGLDADGVEALREVHRRDRCARRASRR